jgi:hypothetical protein
LAINAQCQPGLAVTGPSTVSLSPNETKELKYEFSIAPATDPLAAAELNGILQFTLNNKIVAQVPVLAIQKSMSQLSLENVNSSTGKLNFSIKNSGTTPGLAMVFNLIGKDNRKPEAQESQQWRSRSCDLESAGYRITKRVTPTGDKEFLQVAFKVYTPVTTWNLCELSILIDADGDGNAEQELASVGTGSLQGEGVTGYGAALLDAKKAREMRLEFEQKIQSGKNEPVDFSKALVSAGNIAPFEHSTIAVMEADLSKLARGKDGRLHVKVASQHPDTDSIERDDFLGEGLGDWLSISLDAAEQSVINVPDIYAIAPQKTAPITLERGTGKDPVIVYYPFNSLAPRTGDQDFGSDLIQ